MRPTIHGRVREDAGGDGDVVEIDASELGGLFAAPHWLRDLGFMAWLLVGVTLLIVGLVALLSITQTIVTPVVTAAILAAVLSPLVRKLSARRVPRAAATAIVLLGVIVLGGLLSWMIIRGITSEAGSLTDKAQGAATKLSDWLNDLGVSRDAADNAKEGASSSLSSAFHFLIDGVGKALSELGALAIFLSFTVLSLFFLLKDGPVIRRWAERHMGVPEPVARTITHRVIGSLQGYFIGVTAVAAFNGIVIGLGALVLGVPEAGSIAIVNFAGAYIPYLGAWTAGAFTVLLALGSEGTSTAIAMAVIALLANGMLQQLIQPIAFGAALHIHPLAVLIVTIAGGCLFGMIGLVLAAPVTSAVVKISADLAKAREGTPPEPTATPPPVDAAAAVSAPAP